MAVIPRFFLILLSSFLIGCQLIHDTQRTQDAGRNSGPWNLSDLKWAPDFTWGSKTGAVQEVYYEGEPFEDRGSRVFAYLGRPRNQGEGPFPAVVLVHGGGGKAFSTWAEHWANRGYVSLAMDLSGKGPEGRLSDGGPDQDDKSKFRDFTVNEITNMWTYHAVANVIRCH